MIDRPLVWKKITVTDRQEIEKFFIYFYLFVVGCYKLTMDLIYEFN